MNIRILVLLTAALLPWLGRSQSADTWIAAGRYYLTVHDLSDANASFAGALAVSQTNETANALYSITRLLLLPSQPVGSNFLTRLGLPIAGRNIYNWTSAPPEDLNGVLLAPAGVNAEEFIAQMRTNALPDIVGAIHNLTEITDTNFTVDLTRSETSIVDVTVDYGDFKLIQAALYGAEYAIYMVNSQNLNAQLSDIRALYSKGMLTSSEVLADYPDLFKFTSTNDLQSARTAFTNAIDMYMTASAFIRSRMTNEVRLFNFYELSAPSEGQFRVTLQDLKNSLLIEPQILAIDPDLVVDMSPQFDSTLDVRSLLPKFDGNSIELGSLPDLTFGEMVYGLKQEDVESVLSQSFTMIPVGSAPKLSGMNSFSLSFTTLRGHNYALERSADLVNWLVVTGFTSSSAISAFVDARNAKSSFYRLRDDTEFMVFSGVVKGKATGLPIVGAQIDSIWDGTVTLTDANGRFYLKTTLPASYLDGELTVSAAGYSTIDTNLYGECHFSNLTIYLPFPPANDIFANRFVLTGSTVTTNGNNFGATWENGEPFDINSVSYGNQSVWFTWTAPSAGSYIISVSTTTTYCPFLAIYTGTQLSNLTPIANSYNSGGFTYTASETISTQAGQVFQIELDEYSWLLGGPYTLTIAP